MMTAGVLIAAVALCAAGWIITAARLRQARAECAHAMERLAEMDVQTATLRHDIRGILSPALLTADRLLKHADPAVVKAGDTMVRTVERMTARLAETKIK